MNKPKFTKGEWVADIRGGCCAVYELSKAEDTQGMQWDDDRNIYYSSLHAKWNGNQWSMSEEAVANAHLLAAAPDLYKEIEQDIQWLESMMPKFVYGSYEFGSICRRIETKRKLLAKARGETQ